MVPTFGTGPGPAATAAAQKPFSNYSPRPVISPYVNLYRTDTNFGTISNYYTLVQPSVHQRNFNQQAAGQIGSLQSATRTQGVGIQQLDDRTQRMQGTARPRPFGNYHGYFQSSPRQ